MQTLSLSTADIKRAVAVWTVKNIRIPQQRCSENQLWLICIQVCLGIQLRARLLRFRHREYRINHVEKIADVTGTANPRSPASLVPISL